MKKIRILYAEDDLSNRKMMEHKLSINKIECDTVTNGDEAVEIFEKGLYDLIILDRLMPNKNDGINALYKIKNIDPTIPSMCLTCDDWDIDELKNAGFDAVFIKPIMGDKFIDEVKKLCKP